VLLQRSDDVLDPEDRLAYDHTITTVRAQLDDVTFATAWAEGQAMTLEQAIAEALGGDTTTARLTR
jgi:hypothetical protein